MNRFISFFIFLFFFEKYFSFRQNAASGIAVLYIWKISVFIWVKIWKEGSKNKKLIY